VWKFYSLPKITIFQFWKTVSPFGQNKFSVCAAAVSRRSSRRSSKASCAFLVILKRASRHNTVLPAQQSLTHPYSPLRAAAFLKIRRNPGPGKSSISQESFGMKLISADFSFKFSAFYLLHFTLGGFSLYISFSKKAVQIFGGIMNPLRSPKGTTDFPRIEISEI
jgi:hypothetical protein